MYVKHNLNDNTVVDWIDIVTYKIIWNIFCRCSSISWLEKNI